ncbi:MAG: class I SAM-dependent methyltransferase [Actinobacteria bacterium]|nr:MAG: class I SAM-dependent methyltransferase [Actinomycetota bacterium]
MMSSPETLPGNVASWTKANAEFTDGAAPRQWAREEITWGVFDVPESTIGCVGDVAGLDVIELGCGTAYISAWLAKHGARPVGVDPTPAQLETARRMMRETGIEFPLVEAPGESVPLADASFDLAVSEYGACLWADPYQWIPEAARLLRPGGRLTFLTNSNLSMLCFPPVGELTEQLQRAFFGMYRTNWPDELGTEFHLAHGEWIRLLRDNGFEIEALHELQAPEDARNPVYYDYVTVGWARKWPCEEIWVARKQ